MRLFLSILLIAALPAFAAEPAARATDAAAATGNRVAEERERDDALDRHCLRETGTRISARHSRRECSRFAGRVWSRRDLESTGRVDIADALRALDPSIR